MMELFRQYFISLYQDVPTEVYEGLLILFCLGTIGLIAFVGWKRGWRKIVGLLLAEYVFLIYCSTVICRRITECVVGNNFSPFWSYEAIGNGREDLTVENLINMIAFVPVGMMLGSMLRVKNSWLITLLFGMGISMSIEVMQFVLKRGFAEVDDVIHNTLGCFTGYIIYFIIIKVWNWALKYRMHLLDKNGSTINYYK